MVFLLLAIHPRRVDLQRLVYFDYAVIYSADLGGPSNLHTSVPLRGAEWLSRRTVIEEGLYLMSVHGLVDVFATDAGVLYCAGENAASLVGLIDGPYAGRLRDRCRWVAETFGASADEELEGLFGVRGAVWDAQFLEHVDANLGGGE